jgi:hypothetical protein
LLRKYALRLVFIGSETGPGCTARKG